MRRWLAWIALVVVVVAAVIVGTTDRDTRTDAERARAIGESVRCPTCRGQSVASSDAPAAENVRNEIARRIDAGESDDEIRAAMADRFGDSILLNPPRGGVAGLVWVIPVVGLVVAVAGLGVAFRRWRRASPPGGDSVTQGSRTHHRKRRWGRAIAAAVAVAGVAVGSGIAVAQLSGSRKPGEGVTGTVPSTSAQRLQEAATLAADGKVLDALKVYDAVLAENPRDVAAMTYKGWLLRNVGVQSQEPELLQRGIALLEQATDIDPEFAEAWLFRGIVYLRDEDSPEQATGALRLALAAGPIPEVAAAARELLAEIAAMKDR